MSNVPRTHPMVIGTRPTANASSRQAPRVTPGTVNVPATPGEGPPRGVIAVSTGTARTGGGTETKYGLVPLAGSPVPVHVRTADVTVTTVGVRSGGGSEKFNKKDGADLVYVPAGSFEMGDDDIPDNPRHTVTLSAYYIYQNLVTVDQYRKFCEATGKQMPPEPSWGWKVDHPIVNVPWDDAEAYCKWAGARLPSEAEWEKAARGTDGRKYPWGDDFDQSRLWCSSRIYAEAGETHSVGGFPAGASPCGALDMAGNVKQWCEDSYDRSFWLGPRTDDPLNDSGGERVVRGGSWACLFTRLFRAAYRDKVAPWHTDPQIGFRAVVAAPNVGAVKAQFTTPSADSVATPDSLRSTPFNVTVSVRLTLNANGRVSVEITKGSGYSALDEQVKGVCSRIKFKPAMQDGKAVNEVVRFNFHLTNGG